MTVMPMFSWSGSPKIVAVFFDCLILEMSVLRFGKTSVNTRYLPDDTQ